MEEEKDQWHLAKQIAAGILIAAAVLGAVNFLIQLERARQVNAVVTQFQEQIESIEAQNRAELEAARRARVVSAQKKASAERARLLRVAQRSQAAADRARAEQAKAAAKQQAWLQFYRPASACNNPRDWDTQVECGNAHMRAQREFEQRWLRGEL